MCSNRSEDKLIQTKYMKMIESGARKTLQNCKLGEYTFEGVESFTYLTGADLSNVNRVSQEINRR